MSLASQLDADLKTAMLARDTRRRDVIRFLRAAVKNAAIDQHRELTDHEIQAVIRQQIKQRRDSIDMFRAGGRDDLASEEEAQVMILQDYLPQQLSEDAVRTLVQRIAHEIDAHGARDMGRLMPLLQQEVAGRAEGRLLSQIAREVLEQRAASVES